MKTKVLYSVVIPVYNSEKTLEELVSRIHLVFKKITPYYEVILVDDGSQDHSWNLLEKFHREDKRVKIIQLMRNYGQHAAIICGFNYCSGMFVITMDDDLQNPPEEIPKLIKAISNSDYDGILAIPIESKHSLSRRLGSYETDKFYNIIFNKPQNLKSSSFRILNKKITDHLSQNQCRYTAIGPLLFSLTLKLKNVDVLHNKRAVNKSNYDYIKLLKLAWGYIINYSILPLKFVSIVGIISSFAGFMFAIYIIFMRFYKNQVLSGWTSLIVVNLTFFGLILFVFGIIGEYLIRILNQVNNSDIYVVRRFRK